jgi:hypothetical protein
MQGGVVLLAFGYFEAFVRELIEDVFVSLSSSATHSERLGSTIRVHAGLVCQMHEWNKIQDPGALSAKIWDYRMNGGLSILEDGSPIGADLAEKILAGITYPKLDNIRKLLSRLGIADPLRSLRSTAKQQIDQFLISFHDARVDLAHNGTPPGWAEADFILRLDELTKFAVVLDRVVYKWLCAVAGTRAWPA